MNQSYSTFVRLAVSDENYNDARVALIRSYRWSHVAIIHQDSIDASLVRNSSFEKRREKKNASASLDGGEIGEEAERIEY